MAARPKPILLDVRALEDLALRVRLEFERPPREPDADTLRLQRCFRCFVEAAWPTVEPSSDFVAGIHIDAICAHLQAVDGASEDPGCGHLVGQVPIRRLVITVPPRHGKSTIAAVLFPAWVWTHSPGTRMVYASYALSLSVRDSVRSRRLVRSWWYQSRWGDVTTLVRDQNMKMRFETTKGGHRIATSVDGAVTGEGGRILIADDPHNVAEAESDLSREAVLDWFDQSYSTRGDDPREAAWVIIQQRVHERDLAGHVLEAGTWDHLNLPAEYEPEIEAAPTSIGWTDPRTTEGELLWPMRWNRDDLDALKVTLGTRAASAQLQQRPAPLGGDIFRADWWKYYHRYPEQYDEMWQSWDCAFKGLDDSDYVVGQVWGRIDNFAVLVDQVRERMTFTETLTAVLRLRSLHPKAHRILIEDKANGTAVLDSLQATTGGLVPVEPEGGKIARAYAVTPFVESGHVLIPHPRLAPWVNEFVREHSRFPRGEHDDQVDCTTQSLARMLVWMESISRFAPEHAEPIKITGGLQA